jgi:hypothetical protein
MQVHVPFPPSAVSLILAVLVAGKTQSKKVPHVHDHALGILGRYLGTYPWYLHSR